MQGLESVNIECVVDGINDINAYSNENIYKYSKIKYNTSNFGNGE